MAGDVKEARWLTVRQFRSQYPNVGRDSLYDLYHAGKLRAARVGKRILIREDALELLADSQQRQKGAMASVHYRDAHDNRELAQ